LTVFGLGFNFCTPRDTTLRRPDTRQCEGAKEKAT
jgi:hypothetical protein